MAYWMRVFCTKGDPPPLNAIFSWVADRGPRLALDTALIDVDPGSPAWEQAAVLYRSGKLPFLAEVNRAERSEVKEVVELVEEVPNSPVKDKVLRHLRETTFVVANQIPTSDFADDGFHSVGEFMRFFVEHNGGLIQADGKGFYEDDRLVLELPSDTESPSGIGFSDPGELDLFLSIPAEGLAALAIPLRTVEKGSRDPATGAAIDAGNAEILADAIEVAVDVESVIWTGADDLPAFRWAFAHWSRNQAELPEWAAEVRRRLS